MVDMRPLATSSTSSFGHGDSASFAEEKFEDLLQHPPVQVDQLDLNIVLRGTAFDEIDKTSDLFCPVIRRSPHSQSKFWHLDLISCWKGMSQSAAHELAVWSRLFKNGLALQIQERLKQEIAVYLEHDHYITSKASLICHTLNLFHQTHRRFIRVNIPRLVHSMVGGFYDYFGGDDRLREHSWSLASGDVPSLVYNFVRVQDCMLHTTDGPFVVFDVEQSFLDGSITIPIVVDWHTPKVTASALVTTVFSGDMCRIAPHLDGTSLGATSYDSFKSLDNTISYSLRGTVVQPEWNGLQGYFEGQVPTVIDNDYPKQEWRSPTVLCTSILTKFHGDVRFERNCRHFINLVVAPERQTTAYTRLIKPNLQKPCEHAFARPSLRISLNRDHNISHCPPVSSQPEPLTCITGPGFRKAQNPSTQALPLFSEDLGSFMSKRKASRSPTSAASSSCPTLDSGVGGIGDVGAEPKRQKLEDYAQTNMENNDDSEWLDPRVVDINTGPLGEAHSSPTSETAHWVNKLASPKPEPSFYKHFVVKRSGSKHTLFSWHTGTKIDHLSNTPISPAASVCGFDEPKSDIPTDSTSPELPLSQDRIQRNYVEFEERSRKKAAEKEYYAKMVDGFDSVVSPTDVVNQSIEHVFMEDDTTEVLEESSDASECGMMNLENEDL